MKYQYIYQGIVENNDRLVYLYDSEKDTMLFSQKAADFFEVSVVEKNFVARINQMEFIDNESREEFAALHHRIQSVCETQVSSTVKLLLSNGVSEIFELRLKAIQDNDKKKTGFCVGTFYDITERYVENLRMNKYSKIVEGNKVYRFIYDQNIDCLKIMFPDGQKVKGNLTEQSFFFYSKLVREGKVCPESERIALLDFMQNGSLEPMQVIIYDQSVEEYRWYAITGMINLQEPNLIEGRAEDITDLSREEYNRGKVRKVLDFLSNDYLLVMEIDLIFDRYETLLADYHRLGVSFPVEGVYSEVNDSFVSNVVEEHQSIRKDFGDISKLRELLKTKKRIVCEYKTKQEYEPWRKAVIQLTQTNQSGEPIKATLSHVSIGNNDEYTMAMSAAHAAGKVEMRDKVLLVEEYDINAIFETEVLEAAGLEVEWVRSSAEAVTQYIEKEAGYYSIVFINVKATDQSGIENGNIIRGLENSGNIRVPIIAFGVNDTHEIREMAEAAGMDDFVTKPFELATIKRIIKQYI